MDSAIFGDQIAIAVLKSLLAIVASGFGFVVRAQVIGDWGEQFDLSATQQGEILGVGLWPFGLSMVLLSFVVENLMNIESCFLVLHYRLLLHAHMLRKFFSIVETIYDIGYPKHATFVLEKKSLLEYMYTRVVQNLKKLSDQGD